MQLPHTSQTGTRPSYRPSALTPTQHMPPSTSGQPVGFTQPLGAMNWAAPAGRDAECERSARPPSARPSLQWMVPLEARPDRPLSIASSARRWSAGLAHQPPCLARVALPCVPLAIPTPSHSHSHSRNGGVKCPPARPFVEGSDAGQLEGQARPTQLPPVGYVPRPRDCLAVCPSLHRNADEGPSS